MAIKIGIKPMKKEDIPSLSLNDWMQSGLIIFPILTLMLTFIWGKSPATAGLVGVLTAILAGFILNPEFRRQPIRIFYAFADGGISSARIMLAVGVIGIVLAVVNETGVAIRFASSISSFGEDYLIFALILAMFGAMILGMGRGPSPLPNTQKTLGNRYVFNDFGCRAVFPVTSHLSKNHGNRYIFSMILEVGRVAP